MKKLFSILLAFLLLLIPFQASAQEQLGSITIEKRMSELDTPIAHSVTFELTGGNLTQPLRLNSNNHTVTFSDLAPGTYTIREISTRTGDVALGTLAPTTVSIPQGTLFDVTLQPKTQHLTLLKSANVQGLNPNDNFTYYLDGTVPLPDTNGQLHRYMLRDSLPAGITLTGSSAMQLRTADSTTDLNINEHYTVTTDDNPTITATFSDRGLQVLAEARNEHDDLTVRFSFGVHASASLRGGTQVLNIANLYPDGFPEDGDKSVVSNEHGLRVTSPPFPTLPVIPGIPSLPTTTPNVPTAPTSTPIAAVLPATAVNTPTPPETKSNALASTGASVLGVIALGALLMIIGFTVILRGRREK